MVILRVEQTLGALAVPAVATLVGPPLLLYGAYAWRHGRTVTLAAIGAGLELTDWRGRRRTLREPLSVLYCVIYSGGGRMEHVVVAGPLTETPLVLRTRQWRPAELTAMWRRLGLEARIDDLTSVPGVRARFPRAPLPYVTRHPMTFGLLCTLLALAHITLVISVFRGLADA